MFEQKPQSNNTVNNVTEAAVDSRSPDALLTALLESGINKFVLSSTCATYGESQYLPIDEKHPPKPEIR